jgi:hypothetical protein
MMGWLPSLQLAAPLALWVLAALPLVWLVARAVPPPPRRQLFPPAVLMDRLAPTEETPRTAPPWLTLLRMLALAVLIAGLAGPSLVPREGRDGRPLVIVIDNGWTLAPSWAAVRREAADVAGAASGPVRVLLTAPLPPGSAPLPDTLAPQRAAAAIAALEPMAWLPQPGGQALTAGAARLPQGARIIWWSDGVAHPGAAGLAQALARRGQLEVRAPVAPVVAIRRVEVTARGYQLSFARAAGAPARVSVEALDARGRVVLAQELGTLAASAALDVPEALSARITALRVRGQDSAGATWLLDSFGRRLRVGIVAPRTDLQPLLSDAHYLEAALRPHAGLVRGEAADLARAGLDAVILPDSGALEGEAVRALERFAGAGGMVIRFAGPRLAAAGAEAGLMPLALSTTPRRLDGSLSWGAADGIEPFARGTPFAGLALPADARVRQIVTPADPAAAAPQTWARLSDGSALVSAAPVGRGLVVLFHTTAGPAWSDVAYSGLQVAMLRRALARSASPVVPVSVTAPTVPLRPVLVVDGRGRPAPPGGAVPSIPPAQVATAVAGPGRPPGIYEGGGTRLVVQAATPGLSLAPVSGWPAGTRVLRTAPDTPRPFGGWLIAAGIALLLAEMLLALALAGHLRGVRQRLSSVPGLWGLPTRQGARGRVPAAPILLGMMVLAGALGSLPQSASAQPAGLIEADRPQTDDLQLAYVLTGDAAIDARARAGLEGLSRILTQRTTVEPGPVAGVDPATAPLPLYPVLYWLVPDAPQPLSPAAVQALNRYMRTGGLLMVDTRGAGRSQEQTRQRLRTALRGLDVPPLEEVPQDHVLTRSFYLLRGFPGRTSAARLFTESAASVEASANDGVSPILIGDGDWASAWALTPDGRPLAAVEGGAARQETAFRAGINIIMYALTGNYKADQVHMPALIERLGRREAPR